MLTFSIKTRDFEINCIKITDLTAILGCCALAAILKPIFSFILRLLPIGDRFPRFKTPFLLSLTKGKKEIDSRDMDTANKKDIVGFSSNSQHNGFCDSVHIKMNNLNLNGGLFISGIPHQN